MIGKGPGSKVLFGLGRVPEGYICAHANQARNREFPKNDRIIASTRRMS
jgi:hypothetical protein